MIDHSIQVGQVKCLVILGIRLGEMPVCRPLAHHDMELIDLVPMVEATKHSVAACLEAAAAKARRPPRHRRRPRGRPPRRDGDLPAPPPRGRRDLRHQAQGGLPAEGPAEHDPLWRPSAAAAAAAKGAMQQTDWRRWFRRASGRSAVS